MPARRFDPLFHRLRFRWRFRQTPCGDGTSQPIEGLRQEQTSRWREWRVTRATAGRERI